MDGLIAELRRLYFAPAQTGRVGRPGKPAHVVHTPGQLADGLRDGAAVALDPVGLDGRVRALAIDFRDPADWPAADALGQGVQEVLELPAPAVSVAGDDGFRLWFSLAEPVPADEAREFLDGLRRRWLADLPPKRLAFHAGADPLALPPAPLDDAGRWSAFIDPAMGGMFAAGAWLEMAPNPARQADLLAAFRSIPPADLARALEALREGETPEAGSAEAAAPAVPPRDAARVPDAPPAAAGGTLSVGGPFADPQSFLLAVMNDASASPAQRIEAAIALLPYFGAGRT